MREIKFKAWNKVTKTMYTDAINNCKDTFDMILKHPQIYEVMQYTSQKDKSKVEIYEGDVIQFTWPEDSCWGKAGTYKGYIRFNEGVFEVVYIGREKYTIYSDGYKYENSQSDDIQSFSSWSEDIEVIGNIFENPELLNA